MLIYGSTKFLTYCFIVRQILSVYNPIFAITNLTQNFKQSHKKRRAVGIYHL